MKLKHDFIKIYRENELLYGGNQNLCKESVMRKYGCGTIAAANVISYLAGNYKLKFNSYYNFVSKLHSKHIITIPRLGINGWMLSFYVNLYFKLKHLPFKCHWGCSPRNLQTYVNLLLANDIPVILNIGPNPFYKKSAKLNLYKQVNDHYVPARLTASHFVTITEADNDYFTISSWGEKYYINIAEFKNYVSKHSNWLFSNILIITK